MKALGRDWSAYLKTALGKVQKDDSDQTDNTDQIIANAAFPDWTKQTESFFQAFFVRIYTDAMQDAAGEIGYAFESDSVYHTAAQSYAQDNAAALVTQLDDATKDMLRSDLVQAMEQGKTPQEIAGMIEDNYAFSEQRSKVIARTETGFTWNHATLSTYDKGGMGAVTVFDGDFDPDCEEAAGQVWSIRYAMEHRLQHPNCVRSFGPADPDATIDRGDDYVDQPKSRKSKKGSR